MRKALISERDELCQNTTELYRRGLHYTVKSETVTKGTMVPPAVEDSPDTCHVIISVHFGRLTGNLSMSKF